MYNCWYNTACCIHICMYRCLVLCVNMYVCMYILIYTICVCIYMCCMYILMYNICVCIDVCCMCVCMYWCVLYMYVYCICVLYRYVCMYVDPPTVSWTTLPAGSINTLYCDVISQACHTMCLYVPLHTHIHHVAIYIYIRAYEHAIINKLPAFHTALDFRIRRNDTKHIRSDYP